MTQKLVYKNKILRVQQKQSGQDISLSTSKNIFTSQTHPQSPARLLDPSNQCRMTSYLLFPDQFAALQCTCTGEDFSKQAFCYFCVYVAHIAAQEHYSRLLSMWNSILWSWHYFCRRTKNHKPGENKRKKEKKKKHRKMFLNWCILHWRVTSRSWN